MDFELSKPQKMLQKSVRDFLERECKPEFVRELAAIEPAFDEDLWGAMLDQGWTCLTVAEEYEGMGLGAVELAAVCEVMGRYCVPAPLISHQWATSLIAASGNPETVQRYLPMLASGELRATVALLEESGSWDPEAVACPATPTAGGFKLSGRKMFVSDAATAGLILWATRSGGDLAFFGLRPDEVSIEPLPAVDQTRNLYRVSMPDDGLEVANDALLVRGAAAEEALRKATLEATVAVCAELVGGMAWVLEQSVEYAKTREQFGRTIGHFQAVQHHCANMLMWLESARSATYFAAWAVAQGDALRSAEVAETVSIAKAYCSDAARDVANTGIQVHGGIGFTWEHDLQLYYKRAKSSELLFGDATYHRELIARRLLDGEA